MVTPKKRVSKSPKLKGQPRRKASAKSSGSKKKTGKKRAKSSGTKKKKLSESLKKEKKPIDILSAGAMLNLYYIAHGVPDALTKRGFKWPGAPKKKKKGAKGKKK